MPTEYAAHEAPAKTVRGQNRRCEKRVAPAVMFTAIRPIGMYRAVMMRDAGR